MPVLQSSYTQQAFSSLPGQYATAYEPRRVSAAFARGLLRAGLMAFQAQGFGAAGSRNSIDPGEVFQIPSVGVVAAVSGIGTAMTSTAGTKTVGSGITAGAAAAIVLQPARKLTITTDSGTNWASGTALVTYLNNLNVTTQESLSTSASATLTTTGYAKQLISIVISGTGGGNGTATVGYGAMSALTQLDFKGIVVRQPMKNMVNSTNLYIGPTADGITNANTLAHYVDGDTVSLLEEGGIWVFSEVDMSDRDQVFVRIAAGSGGSILGAFRPDADSASCVLMTGARVKRGTVAGSQTTQLAVPGLFGV